MDPFSLFLMFFSIALRFSAREELEVAAQSCTAAVVCYEYSRQLALEAQERCFGACAKLAAIRQEVTAIHLCPVHTLLVASGINGGSFAKPRRVFGERTEQEVRDFVAISATLLTPIETRATGPAMMLAGAAVLVQGAKFFDARHWVNLPILHTPMHDLGASVAGDSGVAFVDGLDLGRIEFGDALSGVFSAFSIGISLSMKATADSLQSRAHEILEQAERLDEKRDQLEAATETAIFLGKEAEGISYDLFQRTAVAQQYARVRVERCGRKRDASDLPRWILTGLLERATRLWTSLQTPVFT